MTDRISTGVIGLGAMGLPMATTLSRAGFDPMAFDLDTSRRELAKDNGLRLAVDVCDVFRASDIIVFSLPAASHVRSVIEESSILEENLARRVIIDTSTSEPEVSRELADLLAHRGHGFLDAPVSGGPSGAAAGQLSFMVGGETDDFAAAQPLLEAMGLKILHVGDSGSGNVTKLVNNMLVACHMLTTAEGLRLAQAAGVSPDDALRVVNAASGRTMLSEVHFPNWILSGSFSSGFSAGLMRKDVRLAMKLAASVDTELPVAQLAQQLWAEERSGIGDSEDFTRLGDPEQTAATPVEA